jgi:uncharacterized damage-inducible protein DinB
MDVLPHFQRQFAYNGWANEEALACLSAGTPPPRALRFMSHVVAAEWLWIARLKQWKQPFPVWPEWSLRECVAEAGKLPPLWKEYIGAMRPANLDQQAAYTNTKGEDWANAVGDILTHVLVHSAYHRGQVAVELRAAGLTPALTDYIHAVRQGFVR